MIRHFNAFLLCAIGIAALAGCSGGPDPNSCDWLDSPGAYEGQLVAIGMAPLLNDAAEGATRTYAETDGRAKLAAVLKARMNQLVENWSKDTGDLTRNASLASYVNNEAITRQFVDATVSGAYPYKYCKKDRNIAVIMVLRDPTEWVKNLANDVRDQALQDDTLFKTEVLKNDFRDRMDKLRNEQVEKTRNLHKAYTNQSGPAQ